MILREQVSSRFPHPWTFSLVALGLLTTPSWSLGQTPEEKKEVVVEIDRTTVADEPVDVEVVARRTLEPLKEAQVFFSDFVIQDDKSGANQTEETKIRGRIAELLRKQAEEIANPQPPGEKNASSGDTERELRNLMAELDRLRSRKVNDAHANEALVKQLEAARRQLEAAQRLRAGQAARGGS